MATISVFIIDDHPVIRHGVSSVLKKKSDIEVIGEAEDATSALLKLKTLQPDVIVLDITLKGISGIDLIPKLKERVENVSIVIYSMHKDPNQVHRAIKAGAKGYILKTDEICRLTSATRDVSEGRMCLSGNLPPEVLEHILSGKGDNGPLSVLTAREYEIANLIVQGMNPDEIGTSLFISPKTVRVHRTNIMHKLSCNRVNELLLCLANHFPR
jgi:DNA-binding NarL/FixJ family response regulator